MLSFNNRLRWATENFILLVTLIRWIHKKKYFTERHLSTSCTWKISISPLAQRKAWVNIADIWLCPKQGFNFICELLDGCLKDQERFCIIFYYAGISFLLHYWLICLEPLSASGPTATSTLLLFIIIIKADTHHFALFTIWTLHCQ